MKNNINKINEDEEPANFGNHRTSYLGCPWCATCKGWHKSHTSTHGDTSSMQRNPEKSKKNISSYWRLEEENVIKECEEATKKKKDEEECSRSKKEEEEGRRRMKKKIDEEERRRRGCRYGNLGFRMMENWVVMSLKYYAFNI